MNCVYYESIKRELKTKTIYGCRCDEGCLCAKFFFLEEAVHCRCAFSSLTCIAGTRLSSRDYRHVIIYYKCWWAELCSIQIMTDPHRSIYTSLSPTLNLRGRVGSTAVNKLPSEPTHAPDILVRDPETTCTHLRAPGIGVVRNNIYDAYFFNESLTCACMQVLAQRSGRAWYARRTSDVIHVRGVLHHIAQWHATRSMESAAQSPSIRNKLSMSCIHTPSRARPNDARCSPSCTCLPLLSARTHAHAILHTHTHAHTHTHTHTQARMQAQPDTNGEN